MEQSNVHAIPATARVWVYMADRAFTTAESEEITKAVGLFAADWASHGQALNSVGELRYNRFVVLTVDENFNAAGGCSIDSSIRFIKELEAKYNVDFFNRMLVAYKNMDGDIQSALMHDLPALRASGAISDDTIVFNNLVSNKAELDNNWQIALSESVYARLL
ncbi:MAG: ABC transporter ATPase [Bacteroidetes bacterium]|nr:ABC transporter ATPase [Bacteroidota bacterium]